MFGINPIWEKRIIGLIMIILSMYVLRVTPVVNVFVKHIELAIVFGVISIVYGFIMLRGMLR